MSSQKSAAANIPPERIVTIQRPPAINILSNQILTSQQHQQQQPNAQHSLVGVSNNRIVLPSFAPTSKNDFNPNLQNPNVLQQSQSLNTIFPKPNPNPKIISTDSQSIQSSSQSRFFSEGQQQYHPTENVILQQMLHESQIIQNKLPECPALTNENLPPMYMFPTENGKTAQVINNVEPSPNIVGYSMNANGMLQISDTVLEQPIIPPNPSSDMLQIQLNMAFEISKLESKIANLEKMVEQILQIVSAGGAGVRIVTQNSGVSNEFVASEDVFSKIQSIDELNSFEKKLANPQFKNASVRDSFDPFIEHSN